MSFAFKSNNMSRTYGNTSDIENRRRLAGMVISPKVKASDYIEELKEKKQLRKTLDEQVNELINCIYDTKEYKLNHKEYDKFILNYMTSCNDTKKRYFPQLELKKGNAKATLGVICRIQKHL